MEDFVLQKSTSWFRWVQVEEVKRKIEETQGESMAAADLVVISQGKVCICSPFFVIAGSTGTAERLSFCRSFLMALPWRTTVSRKPAFWS